MQNMFISYFYNVNVIEIIKINYIQTKHLERFHYRAVFQSIFFLSPEILTILNIPELF